MFIVSETNRALVVLVQNKPHHAVPWAEHETIDPLDGVHLLIRGTAPETMVIVYGNFTAHGPIQKDFKDSVPRQCSWHYFYNISEVLSYGGACTAYGSTIVAPYSLEGLIAAILIGEEGGTRNPLYTQAHTIASHLARARANSMQLSGLWGLARQIFNDCPLTADNRGNVQECISHILRNSSPEVVHGHFASLLSAGAARDSRPMENESVLEPPLPSPVAEQLSSVGRPRRSILRLGTKPTK